MTNRPDDTKLQVNFKTRAGTLINVYAADQAELSAALEGLEGIAAEIAALEGVLNAASAAGPVLAPPTQQQSAPDYAPHAAADNGAAPSCNHGPRVFRSGVSQKSGKPYKMWACSSQDRNNQCPAQWVN